MYGNITERFALVGTLDPVTVVNSEVFSDVIDMSKYAEVMGVLLLGNMANETVDFKCYYCDSGGSNAAALKSATQLAASAAANDGGQVIIGVRADDLNGIAESKRYIKFGVVTGGASGGPASIAVFANPSRYSVAADIDLSTVAQIKT